MALSKLKAVLCSAALVFSSVGAGSALAADVLRVGTESAYAPFEFTDAQGKLVGFDIDLTEAVAKHMGTSVEWVQMPFDGLIPALITSQVDMAVASFTVTEERKKRVNFSEPYYRSGLSLVIRKEDQGKYKTVDSLKGQKLCAQMGSVSAKKAQTFSPDKVTNFNDISPAYMELKAGGCEAVVNDRAVNQYFIASRQSEGFVEIDEVIDAEDMAMVVPKSNDKLLTDVNKALKELKDNGTYQKIHDKWFKAEAAK